jgi:hypothetical protein
MEKEKREGDFRKSGRRRGGGVKKCQEAGGDG